MEELYAYGYCGDPDNRFQRRRNLKFIVACAGSVQLSGPREEPDAVSDAENAVTGGGVDDKQLDKNNVPAVPEALRAGRELEEGL